MPSTFLFMCPDCLSYSIQYRHTKYPKMSRLQCGGCCRDLWGSVLVKLFGLEKSSSMRRKAWPDRLNLRTDHTKVHARDTGLAAVLKRQFTQKEN